MFRVVGDAEVGLGVLVGADLDAVDECVENLLRDAGIRVVDRSSQLLGECLYLLDGWQPGFGAVGLSGEFGAAL